MWDDSPFTEDRSFDINDSQLLSNLPKFAQLTGNKAKIPTQVWLTLKYNLFCHKTYLFQLTFILKSICWHIIYYSWKLRQIKISHTPPKKTPHKTKHWPKPNFKGYHIKIECLAYKAVLARVLQLYNRGWWQKYICPIMRPAPCIKLD